MNGRKGLTGERVYEGNGGRSDMYVVFVAVVSDERFDMIVEQPVVSDAARNPGGERS